MIALFMPRFRYASVRMAGNCPTWLRAMSSMAYSFHRTVDVGAAHGDVAFGLGVADSVRVGDCAQAVRTAARTQQARIFMTMPPGMNAMVDPAQSQRRHATFDRARRH